MWRKLWRVWSRDWRVSLALVVGLELAAGVFTVVVGHWASPGTVFGPSGEGTTFQVGSPQLGPTAFDLFCWWRVYRASKVWLWVQRILTIIEVVLVFETGVAVPWTALGTSGVLVVLPLVLLLGTSSVFEFAPSLDRHVSRTASSSAAPDEVG